MQVTTIIPIEEIEAMLRKRIAETQSVPVEKIKINWNISNKYEFYDSEGTPVVTTLTVIIERADSKLL